MKRTSAAVVLTACLLLSSCGREDDGSGGEFYAVISSNPENLDPQLANDSSSFLIIRNIYATLVDLDDTGRVVMGAAESYSVSDDGLEYTFSLREGLVWKGIGSSESVPLTAYDYEYAFGRIFSPETMSPHVSRFSCIRNSMKIYNGNKSAELGVKAADDHTVVFTLETPDCEFLKLLAHPAASPCNEELFLSTQGRYGLSAEDTYCCSAFYITDWNYDPYWHENHITLEIISSNSLENYKTYPSRINIGITADRKAFEETEKINTDCYVVSSLSEYGREQEKKYECAPISDSTSFIFFSPSCPISESEDARKAIFLAIDKDSIADNLSSEVGAATMLIPEMFTVSDLKYREIYPDICEKQSSMSCRSYWSRFKEEYPQLDLNSYNLMVSDSYPSEALPYALISCFEKNLDFYCMPYFLDEKEFRKKAEDSEFEICIDTVTAEYNSVNDFLKNISERAAVNDRVMKGMLMKLSECEKPDEKYRLVSDFEKYYTDNFYAVPLSYEKKYLLTLKENRDIWYDPFMDVFFFKYAKKY